jgi:hypothetical protein
MLTLTQPFFPRFSQRAPQFELEHVLPPASVAEVAEIERSLRIALPDSYKRLLQCARGFWLMGGVVQLGKQHPFFHEFAPLSNLTPAQRSVVKQKGGAWPPPTDGMLCFAEFFMEADGDQVLFDVRAGLVNGEFPIIYYAHEARPPHARLLARSFGEFMEEFLEYEAFIR